MAKGLLSQLQGYLGTPLQLTVSGQEIGRVVRIDVRNDRVDGLVGSAKISTIQTISGETPTIQVY